MKSVIICIGAVTLLGCASPPEVMNASESAVIVKHGGSYADATAVAAQQCARYGKNVRLAHTEGWIMSFDCVE
jgi:ABC-type molybdate transport system substrate-binding protein